MNVPTILLMTVISMHFVLTLLEASCALVMLALREMGQCVTVSFCLCLSVSMLQNRVNNIIIIIIICVNVAANSGNLWRL